MSHIKTIKTAGVSYFLLFYGLGHALIDASCAYLVLGAIDVRTDLLLYILVYNAIAFCFQVPLGMLLDKYPQPKMAAIIGLICAMAAYFLLLSPMFAVILAGLGNALFHVGGGQIALNIDTRKATIPGLFVAPGGIGLALGIYLSLSHSATSLLIFPVSLLVISILILITKTPAYNIVKGPPRQFNYILIIVILLMLSIAIRSVIGLTVHFPWKTNVFLLILLTLSIALGKAFGGILADKTGWMKTGLSGLIIALPLLSFGARYPAMGLVGILVFNFTMPITLVAISNVIPGRAGFSFGLTTLALFIGSLPTYTNYKGWFMKDWVVFAFILFALIFFYFGLNIFMKSTKRTQIY